MNFSKRISKIQPSATLKAKQIATDLKAKGVQIIDFSAGEPSFPTPKKIVDACKKALDENWTYYAPIPGLPELRKAIAKRHHLDHDVDYDSDQISVSCGAKQSIYTALQVLIDEGDEILIPSPYWVSYPEQVLLADGKPVILKTSDSKDFKINSKQLEKAITSRTKLLILNSPSNPTGSCYTAEELKQIAEVCSKKNIWVLSDEIYDKLTYDDFKQTSFVEIAPFHKEKTILINGASKAYSMTGWRVGYACGPKELIQKMNILQGQGITSIPTFIQRACVTAFLECEEEIEAMRKEFEKRRNFMFDLLTQIPGVTCYKPKGAFYLFPNMSAFKIPTPELANYLLEKAHVSLVAGDSFGAPGFLRLSFVGDLESIKKGVKNIKEALTRM